MNFLIVAVLTAGTCTILPAADDPAPPPNRPDREALRERAKNLSPEGRQKMIKEFREKHGLGGTNGSQIEKRREELKKLPPEERAAKVKELRESLGPARREFKMNQQQRETKRKEMKERIDMQISGLQKKKAEGALTEPEQRRLERMQQLAKRLAQDAPPGDLRPLPPPAPTPPPNKLEQ
jgi:hypothetical protein